MRRGAEEEMMGTWIQGIRLLVVVGGLALFVGTTACAEKSAEEATPPPADTGTAPVDSAPPADDAGDPQEESSEPTSDSEAEK